MNCQDCKAQLGNRYDPSEPFYVPVGRGRHGGHYLPPLCRHCSNYQEPTSEDYEPFVVSVSPLPKDIEQLKAEVRYLRHKLDDHMDASKKKRGGYF